MYNADHIKDESWIKEQNFSKVCFTEIDAIGYGGCKGAWSVDAHCHICSALLQ